MWGKMDADFATKPKDRDTISVKKIWFPLLQKEIEANGKYNTLKAQSNKLTQ